MNDYRYKILPSELLSETRMGGTSVPGEGGEQRCPGPGSCQLMLAHTSLRKPTVCMCLPNSRLSGARLVA